MSVMTGSCKWFNSEKRILRGFADRAGGRQRCRSPIFVHFSQVKAKEFRGRPGFRSLAEGEPLEFEIEENDDGKVCPVNVTGPNGDPVQGAPPPPRRDDYGYDDDGYGGGYGDSAATAAAAAACAAAAATTASPRSSARSRSRDSSRR